MELATWKRLSMTRTTGKSCFPRRDASRPAHFPYLQPAHLTQGETASPTPGRVADFEEQSLFRQGDRRTGVWSYFLARGIIDPVDDIRSSNPAMQS